MHFITEDSELWFSSARLILSIFLVNSEVKSTAELKRRVLLLHRGSGRCFLQQKLHRFGENDPALVWARIKVGIADFTSSVRMCQWHARPYFNKFQRVLKLSHLSPTVPRHCVRKIFDRLDGQAIIFAFRWPERMGARVFAQHGLTRVTVYKKCAVVTSRIVFFFSIFIFYFLIRPVGK